MSTDDAIGNREGHFDARPDKLKMTSYAFAAPAPVLPFWFDIREKVAEVPVNAFKAVVKKVEIIKYVNYHLSANQDPLIIPIKDLRDGWALNFSATNEVILAVAFPTVDPFRLTSIHIYKNSNKLETPVATFYEMSLTIRRYIQYKNPLIHVTMSYQNSNGVLLAMDSSRITGIDWRGIYYNTDSQFTLQLYTQIILMETTTTNLTTPALTLLIDPKMESTDTILNSYKAVWLTSTNIDSPEDSKGTLAFYQGFPSEIVDEKRIISDRGVADFLYLEGAAVTVVYRRASWKNIDTSCLISMYFSRTFPDALSELPFNGTITRYSDPEGNERNPIMFSDLGSKLKYSLKLNDNPDQVTVFTSDNNSAILTEVDGLKEFTSRGLNMRFTSGSVEFTIERVANTSSSNVKQTAHIYVIMFIYGFY